MRHGGPAQLTLYHALPPACAAAAAWTTSRPRMPAFSCSSAPSPPARRSPKLGRSCSSASQIPNGPGLPSSRGVRHHRCPSSLRAQRQGQPGGPAGTDQDPAGRRRCQQGARAGQAGYAAASALRTRPRALALMRALMCASTVLSHVSRRSPGGAAQEAQARQVKQVPCLPKRIAPRTGGWVVSVAISNRWKDQLSLYISAGAGSQLLPITIVIIVSHRCTSIQRNKHA